MWGINTGKTTSSAPKLCMLPTTIEAFCINVLRAHLQLSHWYAALKTDPPHLDPLKFGFEADETNKVLNPVPLPTGVESAPDFVIKLIKYSHESSKPCKVGIVGVTACRHHAKCSVHAVGVKIATTRSRSM